MSTKVEQASTVELRNMPTPATATPAGASTSSPKVSMFAAKSGFVIPKNKLSGSLVPIFRGGKKPGSSDAVHEESAKQVQRKTKWGPDLTQDAAVRKGRALAYQTRVDQITQQLKLGILETRDDQHSPPRSQIADHDSLGYQINSKKSEMLELERREAIGEIIKLNPSYKVPADYKPLLKEAKVPIPINEYPGLNFIGLIFGPATDTQKRLEKETGAKIRVYGTKADTGEKGEITPSDGNELYGVYKAVFVLVSADTYEKVDAAVSLIELLVTPVSANSVAVSISTTVSGNNVNDVNLGRGTPTPNTIPPPGENQGAAQPMIGSAHAPQVQFQPYPGPWFTTGPPLGFIAPQNPSAPILSNPVQLSSSPLNPSNMPSLFGPQPVLAAGFGSVPQSRSLVSSRPQPPVQVLQRPYMPQAPPPGHIVPSSNMSASPSFTSNQPTPAGPSQIARPLLPSLPQSAPPVTFLDQRWTPVGSSTGWSQAPAGTPTSLVPSNMVQMGSPMVPPQGPHPVAPQPIVLSRAPLPNISSAGNMVSPITFPSWPSAPQSSGAAANQPIAAPAFPSVPQHQVGLSSASSSLLPMAAPRPSPVATPDQSSSIAQMQSVMARTAVLKLSPNPVPGSTPITSTVASASTPLPLAQPGISSSVSGSAPSFTPVKPPSVTAPKPQHPSSSDFTFQPHQPRNPASQVVPRPGSQAMPPPPSNQMAQTSQAPQTTSFRPAMHNSTLPGMQGFLRPQISNQVSQPQPQMPNIFAGNPTGPPAPLRTPPFPNPSPVASAAPVPRMGPRNFSPAPYVVNSAGPFPPMPGNPVQLQQNYPATTPRPQNLLAPSQQFGTNIPFASGKPGSSPSGAQQVYDPFSPTSVSIVPQLGDKQAKVRRQDIDPEYEDLMASVGVK